MRNDRQLKRQQCAGVVQGCNTSHHRRSRDRYFLLKPNPNPWEKLSCARKKARIRSPSGHGSRSKENKLKDSSKESFISHQSPVTDSPAHRSAASPSSTTSTPGSAR